MSNTRDRLLGLVAGALVVMLGLLVVISVHDAEDNGKRAFGHLFREPIGFGSPVIEPVLVPHRIACSLTLLTIRRSLHSLFAQRASLFGR